MTRSKGKAPATNGRKPSLLATLNEGSIHHGLQAWLVVFALAAVSQLTAHSAASSRVVEVLAGVPVPCFHRLSMDDDPARPCGAAAWRVDHVLVSRHAGALLGKKRAKEAAPTAAIRDELKDGRE